MSNSKKVEVMPSGISFSCYGNILQDALSKGIALEHSCKNGSCGVCSAKLLSGIVEDQYGKEISSGNFLTCQSKAITDIVIEANYYPELVGINEITMPCKVTEFKYVTDDIVVINFRLPPTSKFEYLSGQYVNLKFNGVTRSYSIASAINNSQGLELHIRKVPNGKMSNLIFGSIKEGTLMRLEGPKGTFFVKNNEKPIILLAGGTGIAPIKAILEDLIAKNDPRAIYVYWGMSTSDSFYVIELEKWAERYDNITYVPVLFSNVGHWEGRRGLVHEAVCDDFESLSEHEVYACGSPLMIDAAKKEFYKLGLPMDSFHSDAFIAASS
jgi:CDP-4-dehydro-6-deoxyglucose reductase, E3